MSAKVDKSKGSAIFDDDDFLVMAPAAGAGSGKGGAGNNGGGIGGGGGSPGGGHGGGGGGGGGGGKPGEDSYGNNLSFPAIFFDTAPTLRGSDGEFTFTTPTYLTAPPPPDFPDDYADYVYFAQGVEGQTWRADYIVADAIEGERIAVDKFDIGDALESAPIKAGTNVRLELALFQDVVNLDAGEPGYVDDSTLGETMTGFTMTLLGGAKGGGKPDKVGPTESQGARLDVDLWPDWTNPGTTAHDPDGETLAPEGTTYESELASIYVAKTALSEGVPTDSYMSVSVQKVTGLTAEGSTLDDLLAALSWDGTSGEWVVPDGSEATAGANLVNTDFGPELNIGGKYIMGASGKPFKFTSDGDYLITFALDDGAPLYFDDYTDPYNVAGTRNAWVVGDDVINDEHNGLLVMLVGVPSSADTGEG